MGPFVFLISTVAYHKICQHHFVNPTNMNVYVTNMRSIYVYLLQKENILIKYYLIFLQKKTTKPPKWGIGEKPKWY